MLTFEKSGGNKDVYMATERPRLPDFPCGISSKQGVVYGTASSPAGIGRKGELCERSTHSDNVAVVENSGVHPNP